MSQLTFDGFTDNGPAAAEPKAAAALEKVERKESWYKGRTLSHSSMGMYRQCPRKWKFRYVDKVPEKPKSFFSFGKSVHTGLEFLFENIGAPAPSLDALLAHYKASWLRDGYESAAQEKWFFQEGDRILRGFYAKHGADAQRTLQVELKFTVDIEGVPVTGFIDRIDVTEKGGLHIVDYKTGKPFDKSRVKSDPQLTLYQMASREVLGKDVEFLTLYHLNSLTPLTVPAHAKTMEDELRGVVVDTAKGIMEAAFEPKPDEKGHCQWCDYMQICPAFAGKKTPKAEKAAADNLSAAVDRFGKIELKIKELCSERDKLGETLAANLGQAGAETADGEFFSVCVIKPENGGASAVESQPRREKLS